MWLLVFVWFDYNDTPYNQSVFVEGTFTECQATASSAANYLEGTGVASYSIYECVPIEEVPVL